MQRSRLKNIANKSKEMMKPVVGEFEQFKNSLPIEIDDNYRLEAAWKAYGKPKNYQEALWEGLVQPIDDKTFKMPSIGYNEETEEYEYLNKGKENETVNRDIRVWDNDVIPFVKELKHGGYIRVYNDEKDCWTYKKGGKIKVQMADGSGSIEIDYPDKDQKAGRKPIGEKDGKKLYLNGDGKAGYADPKEGPEQTRWMKEGGKNSLAEIFRNGGKHKNGEKCTTEQCAEFSNSEVRDQGYIPWGNAWNLRNADILYSGYNPEEYPSEYNLQAVQQYNNNASDNFYKNFDSKTLDKDSVYLVNMYYKGSPAQETAYKEGRDKITGTHTGYATWNPDTNRWEVTHNIHGTIHVDPFTQIQGGNKQYGITTIFEPRKKNLVNQIKDILGLGEGGIIENLQKEESIQNVEEIEALKQGGQMNVIPEGALHARKNNMELAEEGEITHKGIPVVDNDGEQQAEVEKEEWTISKELTEDVERWYKKYFNDNTPKMGKDELAIKCGKRIVEELLHNTDDRAGLIQKMEEEL